MSCVFVLQKPQKKHDIFLNVTQMKSDMPLYLKLCLQFPLKNVKYIFKIQICVFITESFVNKQTNI